MSTTEAVAEIFVAGLLAELWLAIGFAAALTCHQVDQLVAVASSPAGLIVLGAAAYQLGWIVNSVSFAIARFTYIPFLVRKAFGKGFAQPQYEHLKVAVYGESRFEHLILELERETAVDRVGRAGGFNLMALAAVLLLPKPALLPLSATLVVVVLSLLSWRLAFRRRGRYYRLLAQARSHFFPLGVTANTHAGGSSNAS